MKKILLIIILLASLILIPNLKINAEDSQTSAPYDTYAIGPNGRPIKTQTAYEPAGTINLGLSRPEDLYMKDDVIFIADTGNKRILKYYLDGTLKFLLLIWMN